MISIMLKGKKFLSFASTYLNFDSPIALFSFGRLSIDLIIPLVSNQLGLNLCCNINKLLFCSS